jgi:hypothetical protein
MNVKCGDPMAELHLGIAVLSRLPIAPTDFHSNDASRVYDLIGRITEQFLSLIESKLNFSSEEMIVDQCN